LHTIHLILANDLDGNFAMLSGQIARTVDIAEGTVAHFL
jgi:hypothetical protein